MSGAAAGTADGDDTVPPAEAIFHATSPIAKSGQAHVQTDLRRCILRAFVGCDLLASFEAKVMLVYLHRGISVDAGMTSLALMERIAGLVPPPHAHRHRYFEVLAPNSTLRPTVTALAQAAVGPLATAQTEPAILALGAPGLAALGNVVLARPEPAPPLQSKAHYLWALLIARIYKVCPLLCPNCGGQMRLITFSTHSAAIGHILDCIGVDSQPPHIAPACGPQGPVCDDGDAQIGEDVSFKPDPAPGARCVAQSPF